VYRQRPDLQKEMPEVRNGEYTHLLNWAINFGIKEDDYRPILEPFKEYYIQESQ